MRRIRRQRNDPQLHPKDNASERGPQSLGRSRRCIASGKVLPKRQLLRFVVREDGSLVFDAEEKLPGFGYWLSADRGALERACRNGLFSKVARRNVKVPDKFIGLVACRLRQRCLNTLGIARRAGVWVFGHQKTSDSLQSEMVAVLLAATDGSKAELLKLQLKSGDVPVVDDFSAMELGRTAGRTRIVFGAIHRSRIAESFLEDIFRLRGVDRTLQKTDSHASLLEKPANTDLL